jgi:hypothetical protein
VPSYSYELHLNDQVTSTGHLTTEEPLRPGDQVHVAGTSAQVDQILPADSSGAERLILRVG